jgi:hypothetical protein
MARCQKATTAAPTGSASSAVAISSPSASLMGRGPRAPGWNSNSHTTPMSCPRSRA